MKEEVQKTYDFVSCPYSLGVSILECNEYPTACQNCQVHQHYWDKLTKESK